MRKDQANSGGCQQSAAGEETAAGVIAVRLISIPGTVKSRETMAGRENRKRQQPVSGLQDFPSQPFGKTGECAVSW